MVKFQSNAREEYPLNVLLKLYVEPKIKFERLLLKASASASLTDYERGDKINDLKVKLVLLDPYEWKTD
ncbi:hypothetical protein [Flavobacterium sp. PS2]|uniref:hypothetical protein n=1 Tax=Flavobacterium sp. PS2 TaxID=3384157 RepID=UPI00390C4EAB